MESINVKNLLTMKSFLFSLFLFPLCLHSQSDELNITKVDLCPNLFQDSIVDSSYVHYYTTDLKDTVYFNNLNCVQLLLITDPYGTVLWKSKGGLANGLCTYVYWLNDEKTVLKGRFGEGIFKEGSKEIYYSNGSLKARGAAKGICPIGLWEYFTPEGLLDYRVQYFECGYGIEIEMEEIRED